MAPGKYGEVLSTQLYCFGGVAAREDHPPMTSFSTPPRGASSSATAATLPAGVPSRSSSSSSCSTMVGDGGGITRASGGSVTAVQAAAAVQDMLSAAGLPAGAETRQLVQQALELRQERDALTAQAAKLSQVLLIGALWIGTRISLVYDLRLVCSH